MVKKIKLLHKILHLIKQSYIAFTNDRGLKLSAALAYYTIFSIAPMLIVLIALTGIFYGQEAVQGKIFSQLHDFIGNKSAAQIQDILKQMQLSGKGTFAFITGVITLIIGASGVFVEIQDSINLIWRVKAKPKRGWVKLIIDRILSLSMIASLGFLLIVSLIINGLVLATSSILTRFLPDITLLIIHLLNQGITLMVLVALFSIIYKILPDVEIDWKDVIAGAIFTSLLFMLGKYVIGLYIQSSSIASVYGAAGSFLLIIMWVYYSAAILYFGAEFTQVYAHCYGGKIKPSKHAVYVEQTIIEKEVAYLPTQNPLG
ncbi:MAG: YihY/virulence factor BrkB family protein [Sphingobacteriales bacterium]|nr:MAG: YihY/virulence factor BrkB family protein [Sphingobacteriales bacterium]TAF78844.1 MAG: YihY/virulence factor BrkB family protein [Sphingobacteriales bacterium]